MSIEGTYDMEGSSMEHARPISEQASRWWVILNSEDVTPSDHQEFAEWVSRSPERIAAWLQTERLMRALQSNDIRWPETLPEELIRAARSAGTEVQFIRPDLAPRAGEARATGRHRTQAKGMLRRIVPAVGIAATALVAVVSGWLFLHGPQQYQTALGEQHSIVLDDGSLVTLNTASQIEVDLGKDLRQVRLLAGEALFQVAHDKARPFEVVVDGATVRAVGTQFNVDRRAAQTIVTVIEGKVAVSPLSKSRSSSSSTTDGDKRGASGALDAVYLLPAERLVIKDSRVSVPEPVANLAATTAWVQRLLIFERRPLGEVAEEFNRYNRQRIEIDSPELRGKEVTGVFQANNPDSFITFLSNIPAVTVRKADDGTHIVTARSAEN